MGGGGAKTVTCGWSGKTNLPSEDQILMRAWLLSKLLCWRRRVCSECEMCSVWTGWAVAY